MNISIAVGHPDIRQRIEGVIESLLALLDAVDGDENLEPEHAGFDPRFMDDREGDDERDCDLAGAVSYLEEDACDPAQPCAAGGFYA